MIMIHKGDRVLLTLRTPGPLGITEGMWKYQDKEFTISRIKSITPDGKHRGGIETYYELDGFVSDKGRPYAVTYDMFRLIMED